MEEPGVRRRLEAIDTNINANVNTNVIDNANAIADQASGPAAKKAKTAPRIFTFKVQHSPVQVQVLSTQTLYDLVDILCRETTIGCGDSVDSHMWKISLTGGNVYESEDVACQSKLRANRTLLADLALVPKKTTMTLNYDYGDDFEYEITCVETNQDGNPSDNVDSFIDESLFPRRKPATVPKGFILYETQQVDLNALFPTFHKWAFRGDRPAELNLFQPGRKQNFGFVERASCHMLFLPCKAGDDLSVYLHCFDVAARCKHGGMANWFSVVVLPKDHSPSLSNRYFRNLEAGFIETKVAHFPSRIPFINSAFPRLAAFAGYRKDKKIPRGWLTYKNNTIRLCSGTSNTPKSNAPKGTAFDGMDQHDPIGEASILYQMDVEIDSLHRLFCVAEGLLQKR